MKSSLYNILILLSAVAFVFLSTYLVEERDSVGDDVLIYSFPNIEKIIIRNSYSTIAIKNESGEYWAYYNRKQNSSNISDTFLVSSKGLDFIGKLREFRAVEKLSPSPKQKEIIKTKFADSRKITIETRRGSQSFEVGANVFGSSKRYIRFQESYYVIDSIASEGFVNFRSRFYERNLFHDWPEDLSKIYVKSRGAEWFVNVKVGALEKLKLEDFQKEGVDHKILTKFFRDVSKVFVKEYIRNKTEYFNSDEKKLVLEIRLENVSSCQKGCYRFYKMERSSENNKYIIELPDRGVWVRFPDKRFEMTLLQLIN